MCLKLAVYVHNEPRRFAAPLRTGHFQVFLQLLCILSVPLVAFLHRGMAAGESGSSSCEGVRQRSITLGLEMQILRLTGSELFLVDGEESAALQSGDFVVSLMKQSHSALAAVLATVGNLQWPVGKDSAAVRVGRKRYSFALPGLVYGLHLHQSTTQEEEERLEALLQQFSTFETYADTAAEVKPEQQIAACEYWTNIAPELEKILVKVQRQIRGGASGVATGLSSRKGSSIAVSSMVKNHLEASPRMMKRIQQARRMSAIAKLFSKTLVRGAISPVAHVATNGFVMPCLMPSSSSSSVVDTSLLTKTDQPCIKEKPEMMVVANVDAVVKVLEAVETAGKSLWQATPSVDQTLNLEASGGTGNAMNAVWTLNKTGLHALFRATAQSLTLNLTRASSCSSDQVSDLLVASSSTGESTVTSTRTVRFLSPPSKPVCSSATSNLPHLPPPRPRHSKPDFKPPPPSRAQSLPSSASSHGSFPPLDMLYPASVIAPSFPLHRRPGSLFQQYSRPAPDADSNKHENISQ